MRRCQKGEKLSKHMEVEATFQAEETIARGQCDRSTGDASVTGTQEMSRENSSEEVVRFPPLHAGP